MTDSRRRVLTLLVALIPVSVLGIIFYGAIDLQAMLAPSDVMTNGSIQVPFNVFIRDVARREHPFLLSIGDTVPVGVLWGVLYGSWGFVGGVLFFCRVVADHQATDFAWTYLLNRVAMAGIAGISALLVLSAPAILLKNVLNIAATDLPTDAHTMLTQCQIIALAAGLFTDKFLDRLNIFAK